MVLATQLVHSLQQLVTVCTDRLLASQPYTVASTGCSVPATQPCTLASGFNNWLQSVPAGTGYTALYTCFNLLVTSLLTGCWLHSPYCTVPQPNWLHKKKIYIYIYI